MSTLSSVSVYTVEALSDPEPTNSSPNSRCARPRSLLTEEANMPYPGNLWAPKPHLLDVRTEGCHSSLSWVLRTQFTSCGSARGDKNCTNLYAPPPAPLSSQEFPTSSYVIICWFWSRRIWPLLSFLSGRAPPANLIWVYYGSFSINK